MEIFKFTEIEKTFLPIGILGVLLGVWAFTTTYAKEGILQLITSRPFFTWVYGMMNKLFGLIGYVFLDLLFFVCVWLGVGVIYTLYRYHIVHDEDIKISVVVLCWILLVTTLFNIILMVVRSIKTKRGVPHPALTQEIEPLEDTAIMIRRYTKLIEKNNENIAENNQNIKRVLTLLEKHNGSDKKPTV